MQNGGRVLDGIEGRLEKIEESLTNLRLAFAEHDGATKGQDEEMKGLRRRVRALEKRITWMAAVGGGAVVASPSATEWAKSAIF